MNSFGQRLKALRKEAGVSQSFVADHIGVSTQSVSNWECDNTMPDISQIVPLPYSSSLFGGTGSPNFVNGIYSK